jgi:hypothetical protein
MQYKYIHTIHTHYTGMCMVSSLVVLFFPGMGNHGDLSDDEAIELTYEDMPGLVTSDDENLTGSDDEETYEDMPGLAPDDLTGSDDEDLTGSDDSSGPGGDDVPPLIRVTSFEYSGHFQTSSTTTARALPDFIDEDGSGLWLEQERRRWSDDEPNDRPLQRCRATYVAYVAARILACHTRVEVAHSMPCVARWDPWHGRHDGQQLRHHHKHAQMDMLMLQLLGTHRAVTQEDVSDESLPDLTDNDEFDFWPRAP